MSLMRHIAGKLATGAVALAVVIGAITWWQLEPASRESLLDSAGRAGAWLGIVLLVPWVSFALIGWVARRQSNLAAAILVLALSAAEIVLLAWLFDFSIRGATPWAMLAFGGLLAAAYNLFACDWIAEKLE